MADANATDGSAFIMGMAYLNQDSKNERERVHRELVAQKMQARMAWIGQGATDIRANLAQKLDMQRQAAHLYGEITRVGIVAKSEYMARDNELAVQNRTWNLQIWQGGANLLAAVSGGVTAGGSTTKGHDGSTANSAIGGAITGGISGGIQGAAISGGNPIVAGIGAILGAYAGSRG